MASLGASCGSFPIRHLRRRRRCVVCGNRARCRRRAGEAEEMDRIYAMNLAMIPKAAQMTQVEVARKLGVAQDAVSRLENRGDMLSSTLYDYLTATPF
jgi:DNA-binding XRE family transcriptional regulator